MEYTKQKICRKKIKALIDRMTLNEQYSTV